MQIKVADFVLKFVLDLHTWKILLEHVNPFVKLVLPILNQNIVFKYVLLTLMGM